jgi:hypothetical protein
LAVLAHYEISTTSNINALNIWTVIYFQSSYVQKSNIFSNDKCYSICYFHVFILRSLDSYRSVTFGSIHKTVKIFYAMFFERKEIRPCCTSHLHIPFQCLCCSCKRQLQEKLTVNQCQLLYEGKPEQ